MVLKYFRQEDTAQYESDVDIIICGCGCEDRSIYVAKQFVLTSIKSKLAFAFDQPKDDERWKTNYNYYRENGFRIVESDGYDLQIITENVIKEINRFVLQKEVLKVVIDISSMTRLWYASILSLFSNRDLPFSQIRCVFYYAENSETSIDNFSDLKIQPIRGYSNIAVPEKPTALVLGVGEINNILNYLIGYFNADRVICFYTGYSGKDSLDKMYSNTQFIPYSIDKMVGAFSELWDVCKSLSEDYRVVIIPCGPKPFTLISFLLRYFLHEIDVWKVGPLHDVRMEDNSPTGKVIQLEIKYERPGMMDENKHT